MRPGKSKTFFLPLFVTRSTAFFLSFFLSFLQGLSFGTCVEHAVVSCCYYIAPPHDAVVEIVHERTYIVHLHHYARFASDALARSLTRSTDCMYVSISLCRRKERRKGARRYQGGQGRSAELPRP